MPPIKSSTHLIKFLLRLVLDSANVFHGHAVPFVRETEHLSVEYREEAVFLLQAHIHTHVRQ